MNYYIARRRDDSRFVVVIQAADETECLAILKKNQSPGDWNLYLVERDPRVYSAVQTVMKVK